MRHCRLSLLLYYRPIILRGNTQLSSSSAARWFTGMPKELRSVIDFLLIARFWCPEHLAPVQVPSDRFTRNGDIHGLYIHLSFTCLTIYVCICIFKNVQVKFCWTRCFENKIVFTHGAYGGLVYENNKTRLFVGVQKEITGRIITIGTCRSNGNISLLAFVNTIYKLLRGLDIFYCRTVIIGNLCMYFFF